MDRISDPQVSPNEEWITFTVRVTDLEANRGRSDIWLARSDGSEMRRLTVQTANDWNARWLDDKSVCFLSTRSGSSQIWRLDLRDRVATQVTDIPLDVGNLTYVPQLDAYLFSLDVYPGQTVDETVASDEKKQQCPRTGLVYDELMFRHWDTWEDGKRSHLFIRPVAGREDRLHDLMPDLDADVPTRPWGGMEEVAVTADGSEVIFTAKVLPGSEPAWSTDYDLYVVSTDEVAAPRCLTEPNQAWDTAPTFSPDGEMLAYLAMERPGFEADRFSIVLRDWATGDDRRLDLDYDGLKLSPRGIAWAPDGKKIYCTAPYLGQVALFALDIHSAETELLFSDGRVTGFQPLTDHLLFGRQHLRSPTELYTIRTDGQELRQITDFNGPKLAHTLMGEPEQFTFTGWNGETVYAYVVKPYDFAAGAARSTANPDGKTWPVTFLVHGGPQGSFGNDFHYRWNPQAYVGAGFATVAVDFHGSTGYGQEFTDAISGHWGDRPLEDLEKGLAAALARYQWMDADRVVAAGASYGAYMINWMHGQPFAQKFKAFVTHDGNLDERMAYYDTEELWFPEWEHGGRPIDPDSGYGTHNPVDHVANWHVPTLVVHGALDYRVVDTQGLSVFTALRRTGVPARLLYYPDENHWVLQPQNSIQWHDEVMSWLQRWIQ